MAACDSRNVQCVKLLLEYGVDASYKVDSKFALIKACKSGAVECAKLCITYGANVNDRTALNTTCLMAACLNSKRSYRRHRPSKFGEIPNFNEIILLLLSSGADINAIDNYGRNCLNYACRAGFLPAVRLLLDRGMDIDFQSNSGCTGLLEACRCGSSKVARYLIESGANVNKADDSGVTCLIAASASLQRSVVEMLVVRGADVNAATSRGRTCLMEVCAEYSDDSEDCTNSDDSDCDSEIIRQDIVKVLLDNGADSSLMDHHQCTAASFTNYPTVKKLIADQRDAPSYVLK
jgi:ankyrin repeat protein